MNGAAVLAFGRIEDVPAGDLQRLVQTNLFGYVCGTRAAIRQFRRQHAGVLVNIASVLGTVGVPYASVYAATKWAIRGLTESVRDELLDEPAIYACAVLPAAIDTQIFRHAANYSGRQPRAPEPVYSRERVAAAVVRLARDPRREVVVGAFGFVPGLGHAIAPALTERVAAAYIESRQFERGERVAATTGNLFEPAPAAERIERRTAPVVWDTFDRLLVIAASAAVLAKALSLLRRR